MDELVTYVDTDSVMTTEKPRRQWRAIMRAKGFSNGAIRMIAKHARDGQPKKLYSHLKARASFLTKEMARRPYYGTSVEVFRKGK